ncbi:histone-lysine N-methyltransferase ASHR3 [Ziziphus jujuba]|uniref:Histone-lysine N-methyltransferase ASHR3 n=1 Tax=Ziziphus jujuba TaxID=326968 RepID=A0A6P4A761_ZIZJJ|nr:histone-lysine N-methyltransferase ASHR3 [Ziziphus jujuba]
MPDLGNLSLSSSLSLTRYSNLKSSADSPDSGLFPCPNSVKALGGFDCNWEQSLCLPSSHGPEVSAGTGIRVLPRSRAKKASTTKRLEDHVSAWVSNKMESGVPVSRCSLPFLVGAKKMVECLVCHYFIYPGEEVACSVRCCEGVYHIKCVKEKLGVCNLKKFKCPQHACFICKQRLHWRCVRCTMASHDKCAAWPSEVIQLKDQPGKAICWRHPTDWRLDRKQVASASDIEEVFCRLPLPYTEEEFKIDSTWKDLENKMEPPPYVHIRRNIYLVKKKRDIVDDGAGCTSCRSICSENCVCRVQCISCSKACHCSENCTNRPFRKDKKIKIVKTELCGWGVEAGESISKGDFIIEYIGEVIDDALCEQRLWDMKYKGVHNFYMCEIRKDFTIDATYKGNGSRFLNHSCNPNCILEKWQADGETRVGVFAARSIEVGEPLTYDYRFVQFGPEVRCRCGAQNCQGYLGTKRKIGNVKLCWGSKRKRTSTACLAVITL